MPTDQEYPASVRSRVAEAIADVIRGLALPGIGGERVYVRQGKRTGVTEDHPCCEVRRGPQPDSVGDGFRINYPVYSYQLLLKVRDPLSPDTDFDRQDGWVESLTAAFHGKELSGVTEVWQVLVEPLPPLDENRDEYQLAVGGVTLLVFTHNLTAART